MSEIHASGRGFGQREMWNSPAVGGTYPTYEFFVSLEEQRLWQRLQFWVQEDGELPSLHF